MAITDTLTGVTEYFINWHKDNYSVLHDPISNEVTNQAPKKEQAVTSEAVYNAINNKFNETNTCNVKQCNTKPAPSGSLQLTLDNFDSRITNIADNIRYASPTYEDCTEMTYAILNNPSQYVDTDGRGIMWPSFDQWPQGTPFQAGLMSPEDKMNLHYVTSWTEVLTGAQLGQQNAVTNKLEIYISFGLRLVFCHFLYEDCPWLKNSYNNNTDTNKKREYHRPVVTNDNAFFHYIRPIHTIWAETNYPNVKIGITSGGEFYVRSTEYVTKNIKIEGSFMWYYRDGKPSLKLR